MVPFAICARDDLPALLAPGHVFRRLVSINDPGHAPPAAAAEVPIRLRLAFRDVGVGETGAPTVAHVSMLIRFGERATTPVLLHCQRGLSRSPAAACIVLAALGHGTEDVIFQEVIAARPNCRPNRWMLRLADRALGTRMASVWARYFAA